MLLIIYLILLIILISIYLNLKYPAISWDLKNIDKRDLIFPNDFLWGVATSAHQVEGNCTSNDWFLWENSIDEEGCPRVRFGHRSGLSCDHWNRYKEDIKLIKELGCNSYRFSIEWSKVEPERGRWSREALDHYKALCEGLRDSEIKPFVTLHHFTNPIWIWEIGGFENRDTVDYFIDYVAKVVDELKEYVDFWMTFNEPLVYVIMGWIYGKFPPGKKDLILSVEVLTNILEAHCLAYRTIHELDNVDSDGDGINCSVGIAKSAQIFDPYRRWYLPDWIVFYYLDNFFNESFIESLLTGEYRLHIPFKVNLKKSIPGLKYSYDWIGINYYTRILCGFSLKRQWGLLLENTKSLPISDMNWTVYPQGLYRTLIKYRKLGVPIFITENGIATENKNLRRDFILYHVDAMHEALLDGVDIRGYFYWSLMDNFEWAEGFTKRFGLYHVDFKTLKRRLKEGSNIYKEIIQLNRQKEFCEK